jgi:hypothetical protein
MESTLKSQKISVERKLFYFDLKKNSRGCFLRITEDVNGRRDTIILPSTGLIDFAEALQEIIEYHKDVEPVSSESDF